MAEALGNCQTCPNAMGRTTLHMINCSLTTQTQKFNTKYYALTNDQIKCVVAVSIVCLGMLFLEIPIQKYSRVCIT